MAQPLVTNRKSFLLQIIPVMLCFFVMGFVDLVGTASNYVQKDLSLTDAQANLFPSLVFFWFLIFSVPTGMLMNRIGRKRTVLISQAVTTLSLIFPAFGDSYTVMLLSFSFLGIGNAIMQTSLNPLVTNLTPSDKLASTLTFGLGWRALFVIYAVVSFLSISLLAATPIEEERPERATNIGQCLKLLGNPFVLLCFIGIMCHVGIDVGTNTVAPKIIMERMGLPLEEASFATGVYFIFRTVGCFLGALLLRYLSPKVFFAASVLLMLAGICILMAGHSLMPLYIGIALIGFGNSNVFSVVFSQALVYSPEDERNEVSGLMIMGLFGGTVFPLAMGFAADAFGQIGSVAVMAVGVVYLMFYTLKIKVK